MSEEQNKFIANLYERFWREDDEYFLGAINGYEAAQADSAARIAELKAQLAASKTKERPRFKQIKTEADLPIGEVRLVFIKSSKHERPYVSYTKFVDIGDWWCEIPGNKEEV